MKKAESETCKGQHIAWIDWCRAFAICCVVLCHATEKIYNLSLPEFGTYSLQRQILSLSLFTVGRLGVPIFFFVTGYLLLGRKFDFEKSKSFYKRNLLGLILTTEIWIVIYNIFNTVFYSKEITIQSLLTLARNMLFVESTDMSHMWYMPVIIGIYLLVPFAANALQNTDRRILQIILLFAFVELFIYPELNVIFSAKQYPNVAALIDVGFCGGTYGFYIITGYMWKQGNIKKLSKYQYFAIIGICFIVTLLVQLYSFHKDIKYCVWYNNATLFAVGFSIFAFLSRYHLEKRNAAVASLAKYSFGIYLVHNPVLAVTIKYLNFRSYSLRVAASFVIALFFSWGGIHLV